MNYYKIFYWLTVADNAKVLFIVGGIVFGIITLIAILCWFGAFDNSVDQKKNARRWVFWSLPFTLVLWSLCILTPSKRDSLLILAGGGALNFLTSDSTAKQIPHELSSFVVSELKSMASEAKASIDLNSQKEKVLEQAKTMTAEQLMDKMKVDTNFARIILNK